MAKFEESKWGDMKYAQEYIDHSKHFLPERELLFEILISFYKHFVGGKGDKRVLDLGCGDGIVSERLCRLNPQIQLVAVDGSEDMLVAAKKRLGPHNSKAFIKLSFEDLIEGKVDLGSFDFIVSSFAIHHLEGMQRRQLFEKILNTLKPGSFFMNIDVVLPKAKVHEDWYYNLWQEWIQRHEKQETLSESFTHLPQQARTRPENFYDNLDNQLDDMQAVGFGEIACHYQYGLFGIYSGKKH